MKNLLKLLTSILIVLLLCGSGGSLAFFGWAPDGSGNWVRQTGGGNIIFSGTDLSILSSTADGADNLILYLDSGGSGSATRGAFAQISGNESAGVGGLIFSAGNINGAALQFIAPASNGIMYFSTNSNIRWSVDSSGNLSNFSTFGGNLVLSTTGKTVAVDSGTAASTCAGQVTANGATPVVTNTTCALTASRIFLSKQSASTAINGSCTVTGISNATSFTIACLATDTGAYNFWITQEG